MIKLNGVELPCGSVLSVEPADMDYKKHVKNTKETLPTDSCGSTNSSFDAGKANSCMSQETGKKKDHSENMLLEATRDKSNDENHGDDLDDFFSSL